MPTTAPSEDTTVAMPTPGEDATVAMPTPSEDATLAMFPATLRDTIVAQVTSSVGKNLEKLENLFVPFQDSFGPIFRVPDGLRKVKPPHYTPRLVAIGPLHRGNPQLKPMEILKLSFLHEFKENNTNNMDSIIGFITDLIFLIRFCYKEMNDLPPDNDLCEMMLLDSIFIIQIFLKKERKDSLFKNYWWFRDLMHDFLLVENQIPLVIPCTIYSYYYCQSSGEHNHMEFTNLANNFFKDVMMASASLPTLAYFSGTAPLTEQSKFPENLKSFFKKPAHFIEHLMIAYFQPVSSPPDPPSQLEVPNDEDPSEEEERENPNDTDEYKELPNDEDEVSSLLDSTPTQTQKKSNKEGSWKFGVATASRLLEYGVKFEVGKNTTTSLVEIKFERKDGTLTIPPIKVNDWTETFFRNLIAFEDCQHETLRCVTDYIIFMDSLIDTPEDVNILTGKGIIQDDLQDAVKVSKLFNNLYKEVITDNRVYYFAQLSCELNDYRRDWWHQWKAKWFNWVKILRDKYFNSPWSIISFIAAFILLGLAIVQTVCSIYQAKA